jgi:capsular polysaccharide biosynthesis protein
VNDPDQTMTWSRSDELLGRLWADDIPVDEDRSAADLTAGGLVSLGFFTTALRRRAWVWCLTGVLGLVIGAGLYLTYPPAYHATSTVLLVYSDPSQNPAVEIQTEASVAQSRAVAGPVVRQLKLPQSVASFQAAYTVTVVSDDVLTIDVGAPSGAAAVRRASALAATFLQYRVQQARTQQQLQLAQLDQQYNAAQQHLRALEAQASQIPSPQVTPLQTAQYNIVQARIGQQEQIIQYVTATKSTILTDTNAMVTGSYVIDPGAALPRSFLKGPALYFAGGLFGGIVAGLAGVIVAALLSRRLRRRDDVAAAIGAPVRLSVGPLRPRRWPAALRQRGWPPALRRQEAERDRDLRRVVGHLRRAVPGGFPGPASLAVVAVDDAQVVAQAVGSLAASCASEGKRVVAADLSGAAHLAHRLGVSDPGIHPVSHDGANLIVVLPERTEVPPVGPVPGGTSVPAQADAALVTACSAADLLLTLAVLDPAFGADLLGTWATNAVAVVTAGKSSAEKIHSVGEMIRLAGTRLDSVVLIGADKSDESVGMTERQVGWYTATSSTWPVHPNDGSTSLPS